MKKSLRNLALILTMFILISSLPCASAAQSITAGNIYGDILSSPEYVESLEEFNPDTALGTSSGNLRDSTLPTSVDLSTSIYFPAIGDQGQVGACTSFASVYYQFTYEVNKSTNTPTTPENTYCPYFIYGMVGFSYNSGSSLESNYSALSKLGCIKYSDCTENELVTTNDKCYYWPNNDAARLEALKTRCTEQVIYLDCTSRTNDGELCEAPQAVTFNGGIKDSALDNIKNALSLGKVLTVSTFYDSIKKQNSNGEYVITQALNDGPHAVAIVGYDDNFEVDANENDIIESWERGAFKIANSWGTNTQNHNNGFIWVMYDAFNKVSACPDSSYNDLNRSSFLQVFESAHCYYPFFLINIVHRDVYLVGKVSYNTYNKYKLWLYYQKKVSNTSSTENNWKKYPHSQKFYDANNESFPFLGSVLFDLTDYDLSFGDYCTGYDYYFGFQSNNGQNTDVINSCSIVDDLGETILTTGVVPTPSIIMSSVNCSLNLSLGDLNYDGSITEADFQILQTIINANNVSFSNAKLYLADLTEDGVINSRDALQLRLLIQNN